MQFNLFYLFIYFMQLQNCFQHSIERIENQNQTSLAARIFPHLAPVITFVLVLIHPSESRLADCFGTTDNICIKLFSWLQMGYNVCKTLDLQYTLSILYPSNNWDIACIFDTICTVTFLSVPLWHKNAKKKVSKKRSRSLLLITVQIGSRVLQKLESIKY